MGILSSLFLLRARAEKSATLAWNPSTGNVAGYYVYSQEEDSTNPTKIDVGASLKATLTGLKEGLRYAVTVTAYNAAGLESPPSNPIIFVVPVPVQLLPPDAKSKRYSVKFPAAPGHWYEVQASKDLKNWTTIWQTGVVNSYGWTTYSDLQSATLQSRFYRLKVH